MTESARVEVDALRKRYGSFEALRGCSFRLLPGEVVGLAGPNGAGKSTLARILAGFDSPTGGVVRIDGVTPPEFRASRGIGFLPEEFPRMPGWNVGDVLRLRHAPVPSAFDAAAAAEAMQLGSLLGKSLRSLSKGQLRLAAAAYAMVGAPAVVILDEPDAGLDPWALDRLADGITTVAATGSTVLLLSHQMDEMERVCSRIIFFFHGRVAAEHSGAAAAAGSARELYRTLAREAER